MATSHEATARRTAIELCVQLGMTPTQTYASLKSTPRYSNVSRSLVFNLHEKIRRGESTTAVRGRPAYKDSKIVDDVKSAINTDRRKTVRELAEEVGCSATTALRVLKNDLHMSHVSARWVPRLLSTDEKLARVEASEKFLAHYQRDPSFLSKTISVDETWVHYYEPEDKKMSMVWKTPESPPPKKARAVKSMGKVMCIVFMDCDGIVLVHMVKSGSTVNAAYYSKVFTCEI